MSWNLQGLTALNLIKLGPLKPCPPSASATPSYSFALPFPKKAKMSQVMSCTEWVFNLEALESHHKPCSSSNTLQMLFKFTSKYSQMFASTSKVAPKRLTSLILGQKLVKICGQGCLAITKWNQMLVLWMYGCKVCFLIGSVSGLNCHVHNYSYSAATLHNYIA